MDRQAFEKINNTCLVILSGIGLTVALIYTKSILVPFVISIFAVAASTPILNWLEGRLKAPRFLAVILTLLAFFSSLALLVFLVVHSFEDFLKGAEIYKAKLIEAAHFLEDQAGILGINFEVEGFKEEIQKLPLLKWMRNFSGGIFALIGNIALVGIFYLFIIMGESKPKKSSRKIVEEIRLKVSSYIITKFSTSTGTAILVWVLLEAMNIELAFMFAILTFAFNFIPSIGSIIATFLPVPIILLQFGLSWQLYAVLAISGAIQFTIGNVIEPKFMGDAMNLHPVTVIVFLMFWGLVWGVPGMFMAVPITAIMKIILSRIETTKRFSEMLAGDI